MPAWCARGRQLSAVAIVVELGAGLPGISCSATNTCVAAGATTRSVEDVATIDALRT